MGFRRGADLFASPVILGLDPRMTAGRDRGATRTVKKGGEARTASPMTVGAPIHFARYIRDIAGGDIRDTPYIRDKC